jgi:hypothetical protein
MALYANATAWAAGSASGLAAIEIPREVREVLWWPDRDDHGESLGAARRVRSLFAELPDGTEANDWLRGRA